MRYAGLRRQVLEPVAASADLSYDLEGLDPGTSPIQLAYGLVTCGTDLLLGCAEPDEGAFPALNKRARKRGAKAVARAANGSGARAASVLLAHAMATYLAETLPYVGDAERAARQGPLRDLIARHFPISDDGLQAVEDGRAEYRTLDTHRVREEVYIGAESGTGYHHALMRGEDPDDDPEIVNVQVIYAGRFLRLSALRVAIRTTVGDAAFEAVEPRLLHPGGVEPELLIWDVAGMTRWNDIASAWSRYASGVVDR
jgi:hypothetical protein